jgi:hypothetical protein
VCGSTKAIEAEALAGLCAAEAIGAVSDDAGAEQRGGVLVGECGGERVGEVFAHDAEFGVASVDVVAGEAGVLAQIFGVAEAVGAGAVGRVEPRDADAVAGFDRADGGTDGVDGADDLVTGDERKLGEREIAFHCVEVGVAESAGADADSDFVGSWGRVGEIIEVEWRLFGGRGLLEEHCAHEDILRAGVRVRFSSQFSENGHRVADLVSTPTEIAIAGEVPAPHDSTR